MLSNKYQGLTNRILVDIDNQRRYDCDILGLGRTNEMIDFSGNVVLLEVGDYIYTYTVSIEVGVLSYIFAEGFVIMGDYEHQAYKWCCKLCGEIEYSEDYNKRFNIDHK